MEFSQDGKSCKQTGFFDLGLSNGSDNTGDGIQTFSRRYGELFRTGIHTDSEERCELKG